MSDLQEPPPKHAADSVAGNACGDQPTSKDSLGFGLYVEAIAAFLTADGTKPPITIAIEGEWGSGKSSFLLQLEDAIRHSTGALTVRFNAWRHDKQDAVWAAFALTFVKALRDEIGIFRALRGDLLLFFKRLTSPKAWMELLLLFVSLMALIIGSAGLWIFLSNHPSDLQNLRAWLLTATPKSQPDVGNAPSVQDILFHLLVSSGTFGTIAALGVAGIYKFHTYFKMPLSLNLEKYISKPDYKGHTSFVESFHSDFTRLIEAYAGDRRVYIFIDDLDRCDVPRAADLMQAINLMIGDSKNLIFIIGMDREKVAAGVAQKYENILPFLRESADWKRNNEKDNYKPLYFGYAFLEKFIQISFSLPIVTNKVMLSTLLQEKSAPPPPPKWYIRFWNHLAARFGPKGGGPPPNENDSSPVPPNLENDISAAENAVRKYNRVQRAQEDSDHIREITELVVELFEYNPRRIKQFINTFRLATYLVSEQGLLDAVGDGAPSVSLEQVGKCVALLLRFPDLRFELEKRKEFFGDLQEEAFRPPLPGKEYDSHWLNKPGAVNLLKNNCSPDDTSSIYSLRSFDVSLLFSILPTVARPPESSEPPSDTAQSAVAAFAKFAREYEKIRDEEPPSSERTRKMNSIANVALTRAERMPASTQVIVELASSTMPGDRLMRILIATARRDAANLPWLKAYNKSFASSFEHRRCILALLAYSNLMTRQDRIEIYAELQARWPEIEQDRGRVTEAYRLLDLTMPKPASAESPGQDAGKSPHREVAQAAADRIPRKVPAKRPVVKKAVVKK